MTSATERRLQSLGRLAAYYEVRAANVNLTANQRADDEQRAQYYRRRQLDLLADEPRPGIFETWHDRNLLAWLIAGAIIGGVLALIVGR